MVSPIQPAVASSTPRRSQIWADNSTTTTYMTAMAMSSGEKVSIPKIDSISKTSNADIQEPRTYPYG
jgi:hypothetical protein